MPGAFTIAAHGGTEGIWDESRNRPVAPTPGDLLASVLKYRGYKKGVTTFFFSCNTGTLYNWMSVGSPYNVVTYAQQYADVSRGNVISTAGQIFMPKTVRDGVEVRTDGEFILSKPDGKFSDNLGNRLIYNAESGMTTFYQDKRKRRVFRSHGS